MNFGAQGVVNAFKVKRSEVLGHERTSRNEACGLRPEAYMPLRSAHDIILLQYDGLY